jgi:hypothetical protein
MALDPQQVAKRVLIAYKQLNEIIKDSINPLEANAHIESYNRILDTLNECFAIDEVFKKAISHLRHLTSGTKYI